MGSMAHSSGGGEAALVAAALVGLALTAGLGGPPARARTALPAPTSSTQTLLAQARAANPQRYQLALDAGAQIVPTPDGRSFALVWLPSGAATTPTRPWIGTLHGHASWAFDEFALW